MPRKTKTPATDNKTPMKSKTTVPVKAVKRPATAPEKVEAVEATANATTTATVAAKPAVPAEVVDTTLVDSFTEFMAKLQQVTALMSSLRTDFRSLEKRANRELRNAQKANAKRKRKTGNRSPSGFVKPTLISEELATFLDKPKGTEMARTEVTREINAYIRKHSLQDKSNGRKINPDGALQKLLKLTVEDELTYFNLQRYMSPHFAKAGAAPLAN